MAEVHAEVLPYIRNLLVESLCHVDRAAVEAWGDDEELLRDQNNRYVVSYLKLNEPERVDNKVSFYRDIHGSDRADAMVV